MGLGSGAAAAVLGAMIRGVCACAVFLLFAFPIFGQMAADIARGTPAEAVIRTHGWPRGKSVANGRESWLYDRFQVMFEDGKVVSVAYISPSTPGTTKTIPAPPVAPKSEPAVSQPASGAGATRSTNAAAAPQSGNERNTTTTAVSEPMFSRPVLWGVVIVGALGFGAAVLLPLIARRSDARAASEISPEPRTVSRPTPAEDRGPTTPPAATEPDRQNGVNGHLARRRGEVGPTSRSRPPTSGPGV
jgi:hypothetical protein